MMVLDEKEEAQRLLVTGRPANKLFVAAAISTHTLALLLVLMMAFTLQTFMGKPGVSTFAWKSFALHPMLMTIAFGLLGPVGSVSWRVYGDYLGGSRQRVKLLHFALATAAVVIGSMGVYDMWLVHEGGAEAQRAKGWAVHFQSSHSWVGILGLVAFAYQWFGGLVLFYNPFVPHPAQTASKGTHAMFGSLALYSTMISLITGILSLAGRGDNHATKDVLYKIMAVVALLLCAATSIVFATARPAQTR
jgi:cytochrome b-561